MNEITRLLDSIEASITTGELTVVNKTILENCQAELKDMLFMIDNAARNIPEHASLQAEAWWKKYREMYTPNPF